VECRAYRINDLVLSRRAHGELGNETVTVGHRLVRDADASSVICESGRCAAHSVKSFHCRRSPRFDSNANLYESPPDGTMPSQSLPVSTQAITSPKTEA